MTWGPVNHDFVCCCSQIFSSPCEVVAAFIFGETFFLSSNDEYFARWKSFTWTTSDMWISRQVDGRLNLLEDIDGRQSCRVKARFFCLMQILDPTYWSSTRGQQDPKESYHLSWCRDLPDLSNLPTPALIYLSISSPSIKAGCARRCSSLAIVPRDSHCQIGWSLAAGKQPWHCWREKRTLSCCNIIHVMYTRRSDAVNCS